MAGGDPADGLVLELSSPHDETRVAHGLMRDGYSALAVQEAAQRAAETAIHLLVRTHTAAP